MARVHVAAWRVGYRGIMGDDRLANLSERAFARRWETIVTSPSEARTFVADHDGTIVGIATAGPPRHPAPPGAGEVRMVNVHPDHWRTGAGTALLTRCLDELRLLGHTNAYLWVAEGNTRATTFYTHHGWTPTGETLDDDRETPPLRELRYTLDL